MEPDWTTQELGYPEFREFQKGENPVEAYKEKGKANQEMGLVYYIPETKHPRGGGHENPDDQIKDVMDFHGENG